MYLDALFTMLLKIIPYLFIKSIGIKFRNYLDSPRGGAIHQKVNPLIDHCFTNQTPNEGMRFDFPTHFQPSKCRISRLSCHIWLFLSPFSELCPKYQLKTVFYFAIFQYLLTDPKRRDISGFHTIF